MNVWAIEGNLVRDGEVKSTPSGTPVLEFTVATESGFGDHAVTMFVTCSIFGKRAESRLSEIMKKGTRVMVVGELTAKPYAGRDREPRIGMNVRVHDVRPLGGGQPSAQSDPGRNERPAPSPAPPDRRGGSNDFGDDVPF